jgi:hypothetical protein
LAFGPESWKKFVMEGVATAAEMSRAYGLLPADIVEIINSPCPLSPEHSGLLVRDTHDLIYLPKYIGQHLVNISSLSKLTKIQFRFMNNCDFYDLCCQQACADFDHSVKSAYWILMSKELLVGSKGKPYVEQVKMITDIAQSTKMAYSQPKALEVIAAMIAHFLRSNEHLLGRKPWCYTCCEETVGPFQVVVGGFGLREFVIHYNDIENHVGVIAVCKLGLGECAPS